MPIVWYMAICIFVSYISSHMQKMELQKICIFVFSICHITPSTTFNYCNIHLLSIYTMVISKSNCHIFLPSIIIELQHSDEFIIKYYYTWVLSSYWIFTNWSDIMIFRFILYVIITITPLSKRIILYRLFSLNMTKTFIQNFFLQIKKEMVNC